MITAVIWSFISYLQTFRSIFIETKQQKAYEIEDSRPEIKNCEFRGISNESNTGKDFLASTTFNLRHSALS